MGKFQKKIEEAERSIQAQSRYLENLKQEEEAQKSVIEIVEQGDAENKQTTLFYLKNYLSQLRCDIKKQEATVEKIELEKSYFIFSDTCS
jgi:hypothetical protein